MSGLKRAMPELRSGYLGTNTSAYGITADELDMLLQYNITFPAAVTGIGSTWLYVGSSGTANVVAITPLNVINDFPRNYHFSIQGSATGMAGSTTINGVDQFGSTVSETIGFGSTDNGAVQAGTKVFAQFTSGTVNYGTFAGVNGTLRIGLGMTGTTALFGLPNRISGTKDVKAITFSTGTGALTVGGGTIAAFVNSPMHAIASPYNVAGTTIISVLYKPTFNPENIAVASNLSQKT